MIENYLYGEQHYLKVYLPVDQKVPCFDLALGQNFLGPANIGVNPVLKKLMPGFAQEKKKAARTSAGIPTLNAALAQKCESADTLHPLQHADATRCREIIEIVFVTVGTDGVNR